VIQDYGLTRLFFFEGGNENGGGGSNSNQQEKIKINSFFPGYVVIYSTFKNDKFKEFDATIKNFFFFFFFVDTRLLVFQS